MRTYTYPILKLLPHQIAVFGSNTQGRHGKGAALWCKQHAGAVYGQAKGLQGQSYAIITKDLTKSVHPSISPIIIVQQIVELYCYAFVNSNKEILIMYRGWPDTLSTNKTKEVYLNGYKPQDMAHMFISAAYHFDAGDTKILPNIIFEQTFAERFLNPLNTLI